MSDRKSLFSAIFEEASIGMLLVDQSGNALRTNRTLQEWLGYSADELQSMTFDQFTFPEDIANDYDLFKELAQGKRTRYQVETRCIRKNGDVVWGRVTVSLVHPLEGDPVLVFRIIEDIEQRKKIEQALQANEARNRAIFEQVDIGIMVVDIEGRLLESNSALQVMLEYTGDELSQFTFNDFTHPDDLADDREQFEDLVQNRRDHYQIEQRLRRKDDSFIWVKTTISIVQANHEQPQFAVRMVENITPRKQAEEAFRKAYRAYRMLSQANQILVRANNLIQLLQDVCRVIVESDEYVMAWVGFARQDEQKSVYPAAYAGHEARYLTAITWADTERGRGPTGTAIRTGQPCIAQHILTDPAFEPWRAEALQRGYASSIALPLLAGKKTFGALSIYAPEPDAFIPDEIVLLEELANDLAFGIMAIRTRELHEQAERDLQASETRYEHIVETTPDAIISADSTGHIISWNPAAETVFGYSAEEVVGQSVTLIMPERFRQAHQAGMQRFLSTRQPLYIGNTVEMAGLRKGGSEFPLELTLAHWETDGETFFTSVIRDITERKRAEEALQESEARLHTVLENMPVMLDALDENLNIVVWNRECERVTGYSADEIIHHPNVSELLYPDPLYRERIQGELVSSDDYRGWEWETTCKDGSVRTIAWFNISNQYPVRGWARWGIGVDITERKRAEQQLHQLNNELEQRVIERTAQLNHAKERIEAILNSSNDVMILCRADSTIDQINPAFNETFGYPPDDIFDQPLTTLVVPEQAHLLSQTFDTIVQIRESKRLEVTAQYQDSVPFDADMVLSPVVGSDNHLFGVICSLRDITNRKQMEAQLRKMLEREMELSEIKTRYVSMAAHDLRNPLAVIQSAANLIQQYGDRLTGEKIEEKFDHIRTSIKVMVDMLDDILTLGKVESGKLTFNPVPLDVVAFCHNIATEMSQAAGTASLIGFSSQGDCSSVLIDDKLLRHILGNLLSNAIKYSPHDRPVTFTLHCKPDQITFRVQDQGIGIPEADQKRLFETFHRASNARQIPGTGLGLAIVKQSVEIHGGTITFESEEGQGTTFIVTLPQAEPAI